MAGERDSIGVDVGCFRSRDGLFCTVLFVLSLILVIICSASNYWIYRESQEMAYVSFSSAYSCITLLFIGFMYVCKLYNAPCCACLPWKILILGNCFLSAVFHFIGMAISGAVAARFVYHNLYGSLAACAVFSAFIMVGYVIHAVMIIRSGEVKMVKSSDPTNVPT